MNAHKMATLALCGLAFTSAFAHSQTMGQGSRMSPAAQQANGQMNTMGQQAGAAAQQTMQGGAQITPSKIYGDMLRLFEQQIVGAAEAMPPDKYNFAPTSGNFTGVRTFAAQVKHLTQENYAFFKDFGIGAAPDKSKLDAMTSKADIVQTLKDSYAYAQKGVDSITPANAFIGLTTGKHPQTRAGNASFALAHSMDHYGQMVEYLRMNGIVPPASQHNGQ